MRLLDVVANGDLIEISQLLTAGADPNFPDVLNGSTCLHRLAATGHVPAIKLLLDNGANPNIVTQNTSSSPLGIAALAGQIETVDLLVSRGARLSALEKATGLVQECRDCGYVRIAQAIESVL